MKKEIKKSLILSDKKKRDIIKCIAEYIRSRDEISFAYIYGSFVENIPFHDIDLGIYVAEIDKKSATPYALELANFISNELNITTDVYILNYAPFLFMYHVIKGRLIFERDEDLRVSIVENTIRRYLDIKPVIRRSIKEAFAV